MPYAPKLSLSTWNIRGLNSTSSIYDNKFLHKDLLNLLNDSDITILTETWTQTIDIQGYNSFTIPPMKRSSSSSGRSSGGVAVLFKNYFNSFISLIKSDQSYLWCKLDRKLGNFSKDLFICGIYIPPDKSLYFDENVFDNLENDIAYFSSLGNVILCGDLNARTGNYNDFVVLMEMIL